MSLARSPLFDQSVGSNEYFATERIHHLTAHLPIVPPVYGELSQDLLKLLDEVPIKDSLMIFRTRKMCYDVPAFKKSNYHCIFLDICVNFSISRELDERLREWAGSNDAYVFYQQLSQIIEEPQQPEALIQNLVGLALLYEQMSGVNEQISGVNKLPQQINLCDFHQLLQGDSLLSKNWAIFQETLWAFSWAITSNVPPSRQNNFWDFLNRVRNR